MAVILRGSSRRALTVLFAMCIVMVIFTLTPYSVNSGLNRWTGQDDQEQLWSEKNNNVDEPAAIIHKEIVFENEPKKKVPQLAPPSSHQDNHQAINNNDRNGDDAILEQRKPESTTNEDEDEELNDEGPESYDDGLPEEFDLATFPARSQKTLESKIGANLLKKYLDNNLEQRDEAIGYVLRQANIAYRNDSVYSVMNKPESKVPPSGDMHDYSSLARYFWANPDTPDHLPYIRKDGVPNPDMDSVWDYRLLRKVFRDVHFMSQAYFWTGDERYAEKVVYRVQEWFLDDATKMNPNLKYASLIFGNSLGRAQGVLDMFKVYGMFDGLKTIEGSKALKPELYAGLRVWFTAYLEWLAQSFQANQEKNAHNNHGTYYTVQEISILEFLGRTEEAKQVAEEAKTKRVGPQIRKDGAQPHETIRPISFFYSTFNLQGLILLSVQCEGLGVRLWDYRGPEIEASIRINTAKSLPITVGGGTIEDAIAYLAEYAVKDVAEWPYPDSGTRSVRDVLKMARVASLVYGADRWNERIESLEAKLDEEQTSLESEGKEGETSTSTTATATTTSNPEDTGEPNGFICELGVLSRGTLWHCYK